MLYQIYEKQRSFMEPFADFALATSKLFSNPIPPFQKSAIAQRLSASYELLYRLYKDYEKPRFNINAVAVEGVEVAIHERIELDKPFCELRRFKRFSDDPTTLTNLKTQPVVLIVAPLSGHYATLLRDTVRTMLQGHKVYITDWKNARLVPLSEGAFHLDDYVNYVEEFIRHLQGKYGNCHVMSVCQPTVPVLAAISLMASRGEKAPLSMTMMGGPIDARKSPTSVNELAVKRDYKWFENNVIYRVPESFPGKGRRVYPGFLQYTGFVAMNPDRHAVNHYDYFRNLIKGDDASTDAHRGFYDEYNAVLDMDADYYLETIDTVFQKYKLVNGTWEVRAPNGDLELVRPQDIKTGALLTIEGELDDISGCGQTRAAHTLCSGLPKKGERHIEVKGAGHYGIFSGRRWRETVYPQVRDFIAENQRGVSSAPAAAPETIKAEVATASIAPTAPTPKPKQAKAPAGKRAVATPLPKTKRAAAKPAAKAAAVAVAAATPKRAASVAATPVRNQTKQRVVAAAATPAVARKKPAAAVVASPSKAPSATAASAPVAGPSPATRWVNGAANRLTGAAAPAAQDDADAKATVVTAAPPAPEMGRPASRKKA